MGLNRFLTGNFAELCTFPNIQSLLKEGIYKSFLWELWSVSHFRQVLSDAFPWITLDINLLFWIFTVLWNTRFREHPYSERQVVEVIITWM